MIKDKIRIRAVVDRYFLAVIYKYNRLQRCLALKECTVVNNNTFLGYCNVFCSCDVNKELFSLRLNYGDVIEFDATYVLDKKPKLIKPQNIELISKSNTLKKEYSFYDDDDVTITINEDSPEYSEYRNPYLSSYCYDLSSKPVDDEVLFLFYKCEFFGGEIYESERFLAEMKYLRKSEFYSEQHEFRILS